MFGTVEGWAVLCGVRDYPFFSKCSLADQLCCAAVEAEALGVPGPIVQAIARAGRCLREGHRGALVILRAMG